MRRTTTEHMLANGLIWGVLIVILAIVGVPVLVSVILVPALAFASQILINNALSPDEDDYRHKARICR